MRKLIQSGKSRPGYLALFCLLFVLTISLALAGPVLHLRKDKPGSTFTLSFDADAANYYEIWTSDSLQATASWRLTDMVLGEAGTQEWIDANAGAALERYYRIVHRSLNEPNDADGDGINDVYELRHAAAGLNPLTANTATLDSVEVASTEIAAGAIDTSAHQTVVSLQVSPPGSWPVAVWLEGGDGYGVGTEEHFTGGTFSRSGAATLAGGGQVFVAGGDNPSAGAILVTTDAEGRAQLVLTSSNEIGEECRVHARVGTSIVLGGSQAQSAPVLFEAGEMVVTFPGSLMAGASALAGVTRTYKGLPLEGHELVFYVQRIRANGEELVLDPDHPDALDAFAAIEPGQLRLGTDEFGQASTPVFIHDAGGLEFVEIKVEDLQVFGE